FMNKKRFIVFLLFVFTAWVILAGVGILKVFIEEYKFKASLLPKNFILDVIFSGDTYKSYLSFDNSLNNAGLALVVMFFMFIMFGGMSSLTIDKRYKENHKYGSHGTARWQTKREIKRNYYKNDLGWFLGSVNRVSSYKVGMKAAYLSVDNK